MSVFDEIKQHINCFDMAKELNLELIKTGDTYRCRSFVHEGSNPTSTVITNDTWFSFSDDINGDVIDMLAYVKYNGNKSLAISDLSSRFGLHHKGIDNTEYLRQKDYFQRNIKKWHDELRDSDIKYLHSRKITNKTIEMLHIGYDSNEDRLIIPIFKNNEPVYYCGRDMSGNKDVSKYKKPSLKDNLYKENVLYGLDTLSLENDTLIIAEGVFDFLSFYQEGYTVLSNASGMSNKNKKFICDLARSGKYKKIVLCFDNDNRGGKFETRMSNALFETGISFDIIDIPKKYNGESIKDVSDWYSNDGSLNKLLSEYKVDGIERYLKLNFDNFDKVYTYADDKAPYLKRSIKKSIIKHVKNNLEYDSDDIKDLKKILNRAKTEKEYATEFINYYDGHVKSCKGLGTFVFNKTHWEKIIPEKINKVILEICNKKLNTKQTTSIGNMIVNLTITDDMPNMINCLNLRNGTLYFLEEEPYYHFNRFRNVDDFCTYVIDYDYNPKMNTEFMENYFETLSHGDDQAKERLYEYIGSTFYPDNRLQSCAYLFYGDGSNGKSKFKLLVSNLLGGNNNCSSIDLEDFNNQFSLIHLQGKRVNFCNETKMNGKRIESKLKAITTGDKIYGCFKGKDIVEFVPRCKIFIDCNELPHSPDDSDGWYRRFLPFGFNVKFIKKNKEESKSIKPSEWVYKEQETFEIGGIANIDEKLQNKDNLSCALNLALQGYVQLKLNHDKFTDFSFGDEIIREMKYYSNPVIQYLEDNGLEKMIQKIPENFIPIGDIYTDFIYWCDNSGIDRMPINMFSQKLKKALDFEGYKVTDKKNGKSIRVSINKKQVRGFYVEKKGG